MHRVVAIALPPVVAFDLAIPAQIFGHIDERDRYVFEVCSEQPGEVVTSTGFSIVATAGLEALERADTVIVPGYLADQTAPSPQTLDALRAAAARGARIASVCTGAFALAAAGLLDGLRATTHWRDAELLQARHPLVDVDPEVLYVDNGKLLTSAGVAAGIDLCLHLVRLDAGADEANRIARRMVVPPHRDGGQAQYVPRPVPTQASGGAGGPGIAEVCDWALAHLAEAITVAQLAARMHSAPSTFARRFRAETGTTPLRWLNAQRVEQARRMLETTAAPVEQIAALTGLGTAANLRVHFTRVTTVAPSAYRSAFGAGRRPLVASTRP